jgi:superkiller protein 3
MKLVKLLATVIALVLASQGGSAEAQTVQDLLRKASSAMEERRYVEAEAAFRQAIALDPNNVDLYTMLAFVLKDSGKYAEAEAAFEQALALNPKKAYLQAIALEPKNSFFYDYLGEFLVNQKKYAEAEGLYRQAIANNPKNAIFHRILGDFLYNQKRHAEAETAYRQAIELDPMKAYLYDTDPVAKGHKDNKPYQAHLYTSLGDALLAQEKYFQAEPAYRKAIEIDPKEIVNYYHLGYVFEKLKRFVEARDLYKMAIKIYPSDESARFKLEEVERLIGIASGTLKPLAPAEATRFLDPQDPLTPVRRSVVRIVPTFSGESSGLRTHGTGFVVRRQGDKAWVLTARHVIREPEGVRKATTIQVELYGGNLPEGIVEARLQAQEATSGEDGLDLALLVVVGLPEDIQPLKFASLPVKDGMPLTMVGHPRPEKWKIITGPLMTSNMNTLLVNSAQMKPGGSGSPVLSDKEEVVGMAYTTQVAGDIEQVVAYSLAKLQATMRQWGQ